MSLTYPALTTADRRQVSRRSAKLKLVQNVPISASLTQGRGRTEPSHSRTALVEHVIASLEALADQGEQLPSVEVLDASLDLVGALLSDGSPTPQISLPEGGGLAIEWLVDGQSLTIHVDSSSEILVWAEGGPQEFDFELNANWSSSQASIRQIRQLLVDMGARVVNRVPLRRWSR